MKKNEDEVLEIIQKTVGKKGYVEDVEWSGMDATRTSSILCKCCGSNKEWCNNNQYT